jgi:hypothetical protein
VTTWTVDGLGCRVTVRCHADLAPRLVPLLGHLPAPTPSAAGRAVSLDVARNRRGAGYVVRADGEPPLRVESAGAVVDHVQAYVNRQVVDVVQARSTGLHAAAAERDGQVLLLPAVSGAGKSTLVAGLLRAGWSYVTDEAVDLQEDLRVRGFAKALTIDPGAQHLFAGLRPRWTDTASWYLPPGALGATSEDRPRPVAGVVLPRYRPADVPALHRLGPADALLHLARCTFYFSNAGRRHLARLAGLVRQVPVDVMTYPDLAAAVRLVDQVTSEQRAREVVA